MTRRNFDLLFADSSVSAEAMQRALADEGYVVHHAPSLADARRLVEALRPELVVSELRLGDDPQAGLELITHVRELIPDARAVVATAFASVQSAHEALRAGAAGYLTKPTSVCEILAALGEPVRASQRLSSLEDVRAAYIREIFSYCGSIAETSRALSVDRRSLRRMMTRFGLR